MSEKPIDPYWWCRDDEKFAKECWEKIERPLLLEMFKKFDDPKFWEVPEKKQCRGPDESQMSS
jgi:hypothetical protein